MTDSNGKNFRECHNPRRKEKRETTKCVHKDIRQTVFHKCDDHIARKKRNKITARSPTYSARRKHCILAQQNPKTPVPHP